jgi:hypothetical protein
MVCQSDQLLASVCRPWLHGSPAYISLGWLALSALLAAAVAFHTKAGLGRTSTSRARNSQNGKEGTSFWSAAWLGIQYPAQFTYCTHLPAWKLL